MLRSGRTADGRVQRVAGERKSEFRAGMPRQNVFMRVRVHSGRHPKENRRLFPRCGRLLLERLQFAHAVDDYSPHSRRKSETQLLPCLAVAVEKRLLRRKPRRESSVQFPSGNKIKPQPLRLNNPAHGKRQKRLSRIHSKDVLPAVQKGLSHRSAPRSDHLLRDDIQRRAESSGKLHRVPTPEEEMPLFIDVFTVAQSTRTSFFIRGEI